MRKVLLLGVLAALAACTATAYGDFIAFNDTVSDPGTHANATLYKFGGTTSGTLKDITTGASLPVSVAIAAHASMQSNGADPAVGTDAYNTFNGFVSFSNPSGGGSIELVASSNDFYTYTFSGLNPAKTYNFAGTAIRGNSGYTNRWTTVTLDGADAYTNAHSTGTGVVQPGNFGLTNNQVAINTGYNSAAGQGFIAQWTGINPGADGVISVTSTQFTADGGSGGSKGYGLHGIRLEEVPEPSTIALLIAGGLGLAVMAFRRRK